MPLLRVFSGILHSQKVTLLFRDLLKFPPKYLNASVIRDPNGVLLRLKHIQMVKDLSPISGVVQSELVNRSENDRSLNILKNLPAYKDTFIPESEFLALSSSPVLADLLSPIFSCDDLQPICSDTFEEFRCKLLGSLGKLSDKELATVLNLLKRFPKSPSPLTPEFRQVWKALDDECVSRLPAWGLDFALSIDILWYEIFLSRFSDFHWSLKRKLFRKCSKLTKEQFIRFMMSLAIGRIIPDAINPYDFEHKLESVVDGLSLEESVVVALAYFKTETRIQNPDLLKKLLEKATQNTDELDSISAASIFKLARHSSNTKYSLMKFYHSFQESFIPEIDRLSITACTHLILTGTQLQVPNNKVIENVMHKIENEIKETRLKEFERLTFVMATYNIDCDSLCHKIVDEIRNPSRQEEILQYGRSLPSIMHYLSIRGIFPVDLISKILSPEFLQKYYGKSKSSYQRELLSLDLTIGIELPEYNGPRLDNKLQLSLLRHNFFKPLSTQNKKVTKYQATLFKIQKCATKLFGGSEHFFVCSILPQHHSTDMVFCTDDKNELIPIPQWIKEKKPHEPKYIPESSSNIVYHALVIVKRGVGIADGKELLGNTQLQLRLLKKIGYVVHIIYAKDWQQIIENEELEVKHLAETILTNSPAIKLSIDS